MLHVPGGFPGDSEGQESACSVGDLGSTPGLGSSPGEGNGNALQYSCLENPMDRAVWWATVPEVAELGTTERRHTPGVCGVLKGHSREGSSTWISEKLWEHSRNNKQV